MALVLENHARLTRRFATGRVEAPGFPLAVSRDRKGGVVVRATLPGLTRDEIDVRLDNGQLSITVTHAHEGQRSTETFSRVIPLLARPGTEVLQVELIAGVLTVWVPNVAQARSHTIRIS